MSKAKPRTKAAVPQATRPEKVPACQCCGTTEEVEVTRGNELCPDCESEHYVYCTVCKGFQPRDDECRHVNWTDCGYTGAGAQDGLDPAEMHKDGVFLFFDLLDTLPARDGDNLARAAARAIRGHRFLTQMRGFLLSTPDMFLKERRYFDRRRRKTAKPNGEWLWCDFGEVRDRDFAPERSYAGHEDRAGTVVKDGFDAGKLVAGYEWLSTLDDDTKTANRLTYKWYTEWKADRDAGRRPLPAGRTRVAYLTKPRKSKPSAVKQKVQSKPRRKKSGG